MIAVVDVAYQDDRGRAACVVFRDWDDEQPVAAYVADVEGVPEYVPGRFYRRELPCILEVLGRVREPIECIVVDGHVRLSPGKLGLGGHLFERLEGKVAVIGVAKKAYRGSGEAREVLRGRSRRPLYVTSLGIDPDEAADRIRAMGGRDRIPRLLKAADDLSRGRMDSHGGG